MSGCTSSTCPGSHEVAASTVASSAAHNAPSKKEVDNVWVWRAQFVSVALIAAASFKIDSRVSAAAFVTGGIIGFNPERFGFIANILTMMTGGCSGELSNFTQAKVPVLVTIAYSHFQKMGHLKHCGGHGHGHRHGFDWDLIETVGAPFGLGFQVAGLVSGWIRG